jgi:hypothetical protein
VAALLPVAVVHMGRRCDRRLSIETTKQMPDAVSRPGTPTHFQFDE